MRRLLTRWMRRLESWSHKTDQVSVDGRVTSQFDRSHSARRRIVTEANRRLMGVNSLWGDE